MSDTAIRAEGLSKRYRLGQRERYRTLRDSLARAAKAPFRPASQQAKTQSANDARAFWALRDVSFEVKRGEVVGLIGRNGSGKSTLLKILSRITGPTEGYAEIHGRVGSLLEVGTGFHPELTGWENIYLNGAILGMKRAEIDRKFDEIVSFAEIEKFLGTPVKRYSSGMYVRLAFAVAAHLEPEIVFVDEVLAVGDAEFQKKCLNKMGDVARSGRTVLFVSHNMTAITSLCERAILLETGRIVKDGSATEVVQSYLDRGGSVAGQKVWPEDQRPGNRSFRLISVSLKNEAGMPVSEIKISSDATIEIEYETLQEGAHAIFSLTLFDASAYCVFSSLSNSVENAYHAHALRLGHYVSSCQLYGNLLNNGRYYVSITGLADYWSDSFYVDRAISFEAVDDGVLKRDYSGTYGGVIRPKLTWKTVPLAVPMRGVSQSVGER
jgi:lipopolysaccharide transport system ATP-binding protein